ncbi:MAG: DUF3644 domain-containing protein [Candidatus Bathyarchaeia archaeon]
MKARSKELLDRAIAAMVSAIEVYNKPDFPYRGESFTILATNAWELLLKAKWLNKNKNRLSSLCVRQGKGEKKKRIKKTRAGNPITHSIGHLANKLLEIKELDENVRRNLEILEELRDSAIHFYHSNPDFDEKLQEIAIAAVKNFHVATKDWFGEDLSKFNFYIMPLSFVAPSSQQETIILNKAEQRFLKYLSQHEKQVGEYDSPYAVTINMEVKFVRSKEKSAMPIRVTKDPNAPAVRLTEEDIREKYQWDYKTLTEKCQQRYENFSINQKYHQYRKAFYEDDRYVHIRRLDPANPKSPNKKFFNPSILNEFDKYYRKKV